VVLGGSWSDLAWRGTAWFAAGAFLASAVWHLLLVTGGALLGRVLGGRRGQSAVAATTALLMLALAVAVLLT
jgi:arginine exporter protein ArgO